MLIDSHEIDKGYLECDIETYSISGGIELRIGDLCVFL